jgi:O-6-methylguanine DNA methyltransferase
MPIAHAYDELDTSLGVISFAVDRAGRLKRLDFGRATAPCSPTLPELRRVSDQLVEYFAGSRTAFDIELAPDGTPFQLEVWRALSMIPFGRTASYAEIARRVGKPGAARAVGQANGANPIPIVIPCHRVIAADGTLGGFSSGLGIKRKLLALERISLAA